MRSTSEKVLIYGAVVGGAYFIYKSFIAKGEDSLAGEGSIGGSDDDLTAQQGFDIDPNVSYEEYLPEQIAQAEDVSAPTPNVSAPQKTLTSSGLDTFTPPTVDQTDAPLSVTLPQYALGSVGLIGSYFSSFGKNIFSKSDEVGVGIFKRTKKEAIEEIPFAGKSLWKRLFGISDDVVAEGAETIGKNVLKEGGETIVESGAKSGLKAVAKRGTKIGVGLIPVVGTVAGAEFDVAVSNKPRVLAYGANIAGDLLGGAAGALTSPLALTGIGAAVPVVLSVGGQIVGEQIVYQGYNLLGLGDEENIDVNKINSDVSVDGQNFVNFKNPQSSSASTSRPAVFQPRNQISVTPPIGTKGSSGSSGSRLISTRSTGGGISSGGSTYGTYSKPSGGTYTVKVSKPKKSFNQRRAEAIARNN